MELPIHPRTTDKILAELTQGKIPYVWFYWEPYHFSQRSGLDKNKVIESIRYLKAYDYIEIEGPQSDMLQQFITIKDKGFLIAKHPYKYGFQSKYIKRIFANVATVIAGIWQFIVGACAIITLFILLQDKKIVNDNSNDNTTGTTQHSKEHEEQTGRTTTTQPTINAPQSPLFPVNTDTTGKHQTAPPTD